MKIKKCKICGCEKTKDNTYQDKRGYFRPYCKSCEKERNAKYKLENLEDIKKKNRKYGRKNKEKRKKYGKEYYKENKEIILKPLGYALCRKPTHLFSVWVVHM